MNEPTIRKGNCPKCKERRDIVLRKNIEQCRICYFPYDNESWT